MEIYLKQEHTFSVPVTVAEHLLGLASHSQLKVLLYLLCHADEPLSSAQVAQSCKVSEDAVEEAVSFWQDANVLLSAPQQPAVHLTDSAPEQSAAAVIPLPQPPVQPAAVPRVRSSSSNLAMMPSEIAARIQENRNLAEMFRAAEQLAGRPLNNTESKSLIWMHEYLGLAPDLILMLAAFCVEHDCFQVRYMEQIAVEWQERGVMTHKAVAADIRRRTEARTFTGKIMKLFEMQRRPTSMQQKYIDGWQSLGLSMELIEMAYEKTLNKKGSKLSFSYLDGILQKWAAAGIRTPDDVQREDAQFYAKKKAAENSAAAPQKNSSIDMSDVEKLMNPY
ncbi:MAG: DnaD domain protein [Oscillospiraceae bacterium]|nr:DnaD domain protein [Oscillospiraceae bacterium]